MKNLDETIEVELPTPDFYPGAYERVRITRGEYNLFRAIGWAGAVGLAILSGVAIYNWCEDGAKLPSASAIRGAIAP